MTTKEARGRVGYAMSDVEQAFDVDIDGNPVTFIPSGPYHAKLRRDDEEVLWLAYVNGPGHGQHVDETLTLGRLSTRDAVVRAYRAARRVRALSLPVRRLLEIAPLIYRRTNWQDEAALNLGVSGADILAWLEGAEPPDWLMSKILDLKPRVAFARRRHQGLALRAEDLIDALGGYDDASWGYPERASGPDDF